MKSIRRLVYGAHRQASAAGPRCIAPRRPRTGGHRLHPRQRHGRQKHPERREQGLHRQARRALRRRDQRRTPPRRRSRRLGRPLRAGHARRDPDDPDLERKRVRRAPRPRHPRLHRRHLGGVRRDLQAGRSDGRVLEHRLPGSQHAPRRDPARRHVRRRGAKGRRRSDDVSRRRAGLQAARPADQDRDHALRGARVLRGANAVQRALHRAPARHRRRRGIPGRADGRDHGRRLRPLRPDVRHLWL